MEFHPAANLFPLLEGEGYEELKKDIQKFGCREPIITFENMVLDGRNRWRICTELGFTPPIKEWDSNGSPTGYVLSMNLHRRHLNASQRAMIAANALRILEEEAKARQREAGKHYGKGHPKQEIPPIVEGPNGEATEIAAKAVGVSRSYVADAKSIKNMSPEIAQKILEKEMTISRAKKLINGKQEKEEKKSRNQEKEIESQNFRGAFDDFLQEIREARDGHWVTTSRQVALDRVQMLQDEIRKEE